MLDATPIHVVEQGGVIATVYKIPGFQTEYRVTVQVADSGTLECGPDELRSARKVMEQAEYFIRHEEQMAQMMRCPGCGDG